MRKFVVIVLGLASFGAFTQHATAEPNCDSKWVACTLIAQEVRRAAGDVEGDKVDGRCEQKVQECRITGKWANLPGKFPPGPPQGIDNTADGVGAGFIIGSAGGSKPKPGASRTVDGGIIMVTPQGKEWVWNGKTTTVQTVSRPGHQEYITVMQGDPNVTLTKVVNGRRYNVADPAYAAAIAAQQANNNVVVRDHRTNKPGSSPPGNTPPASGTNSAANGNAPSAAAPGIGGAAAASGPEIRDHRSGASSLPPPFVASGINKKPARNAQ